MNRDVSALRNQFFDVLIIGGGIFGAGVARDASLRGLSVALIDKSDFASGTSSRSSKLIHGGFRYLEQRAFRLVSEACRERAVLQHIAPHLVRSLSFLMPVYRSNPHGLATIRAGMTLYDLMTPGRGASRHQPLAPMRTLMKETGLARTGLVGSVLFQDCQEDDARFCLENILDAAERGTACANHCEVTGFVTREERVAGVRVRDRLTGNPLEITARVFVNATGPWIDRVVALTPFGGREPTLSPTKGVHLVLQKLTQRHAIAFQARRDGRVLFILPWGDCSIVGTTDTDFDGEPDDVRAEPADVEYLLDEVHALLPGANADASDIITTFAGVRSLLRAARTRPSARSREHRIIRHGANLLSIAGGKYTTYRLIAREVVNRVEQLLGRKRSPCRTGETPLRLHRPTPAGEKIADLPEVFASDVVHACQHEMAMTVGDVMRRRTSLALSRNGGPETVQRVARTMAGTRGWDDAELRRQLQQYSDEWKRSQP